MGTPHRRGNWQLAVVILLIAILFKFSFSKNFENITPQHMSHALNVICESLIT